MYIKLNFPFFLANCHYVSIEGTNLHMCFCSSLWFSVNQVEPIRNFFAALFLASIGMLINVQFLWNHVDILLAAVILVIVVKTVVVAIVVKGFGYNNKTSLLVRFQKLLIDPFISCILLTEGLTLSNICRLECLWHKSENLLLFY